MTMTAAIKMLLKELETLEAKLAANDNMVREATAKLALYSSVGFDFANHDLLRRLRANDMTIKGVPDAEAYRPAATPEVNAAPKPIKPIRTVRVGGVKVTDDQLFDVLTNRFQTPDQIVKTLGVAGITVSKALVYLRMPKLVEARSGLIEADGKAWRLKRQQPVTKRQAASSMVAKPTARKAPASKGGTMLAYAKCRKLVESLLTNEFKSVSTIYGQASRHGWKSRSMVEQALNDLVRSGLAVSAFGSAGASFARA